jgi:hypothetical protein
VSIRVGESWTARNGHRRYVSMGLGTYLLGRGVWGLLILPFAFVWWCLLTELWLAAEFLLLTVTGLAAITAVLRHEARPGNIALTSLRYGLFMIGLKGAP